MKRFFRNNGLSLVLAACFLGFWCGQAVSGWHVRNDDAVEHGRNVVSFGDYLLSGHFWQATGENWESEFLQMGAYVLLTCFLYQKGSAESKDPDDPQSGQPSRGERKRHGFLYRNSLSMAFILLFSASFVIHASGGLKEENAERAEHHLPPESMREFLSGSEFWFQSFQNWQSEFLAVLSIVLLSIFLRQDGSPESKRVDQANGETGD
jgi:hypothetical protein